MNKHLLVSILVVLFSFVLIPVVQSIPPPSEPNATNMTQTISYTEGALSTTMSAIVVSDPDFGEIITVTLTLANPGAGVLSSSSGNGETYNATNGIWTITGSVSVVNDALAVLNFTPSATNDFNSRIISRVRDLADTGPVDGIITLDIIPVNNDPVFISTPSPTGMEGVTYSYTAMASDPDGDRITYSDLFLPSWLTLEPGDAIDIIAGSLSTNDLQYPACTRFDAAGNMYIGDWGNHVIRKIDAVTGTSTVVAGTGIILNPGDPVLENVLATSVNINGCSDIQFDSQGNMYFSDYNTRCIRRVDAITHIITTVLGVPWTSGTPALSFTGGVSNTLTAYGTAISYVWTFVINSSDEIFIADAANNCIYKLYNNVLSLIAGFPGGYSTGGDLLSGSAEDVRFNAPAGIAIDVNGDLYIADRDNYLIRKINIAEGTFTTIAGTFGINTSTGDGGDAISATIIAPYRVAVDEHGNVYFTEEDESGLSPTGLKIRRIDRVTGIINTVAGDGTQGTGGNGGPATLAQLFDPQGLTLDANGNIFIADGSSNVVRKVFNRAIMTGTPSEFDIGTNYVIIEAFDGTNSGFQYFIITVSTGPHPPVFISPPITNAREGIVYTYPAMAYDFNGDRLTYSASGLPSWLSLGPSDEIDIIAGSLSTTDLQYPACTRFDYYGNMYIGDWGNHVIRKIDAVTGVNTVVAGTGVILNDGDPVLENVLATSVNINGCSDIQFDSQDNMYFSDYNTRCIRRVDAITQMITTVLGVPWTSGTPALSFTGGVSNSLAAYGTAIGYVETFAINWYDELFIADAGNNCIYVLYNDDLSLLAGFPGAYTTGGDLLSGYVEDLRLNAPTGIGIDLNGDLYIADRDNYLIRKIYDADGTFTTIAGTFGVNTSTGDGSAATSATLIAPHRVAADDFENVYITEEDKSGLTPAGLKIRRIDEVTGIISTVVGDGTRGTGGNGGPATLAQLYDPLGLTLDPWGNIFIADGSSNVVREVFNGAILTGTPAQSDIGAHNITINTFDGTNTVSQYFVIKVITGPHPPAFISTPVTTAKEGVAYAYSAVALDGNGDRITYSATGLPSWLTLGPSDEIDIIAGSLSTTDLQYPVCTRFDAAGNMYIGDWINRVIRKIDAVTGVSTVVVGNGATLNPGDLVLENVLATSVSINGCSDIQFDSQGNMFFSEYNTQCLRRVDAITHMITTVLGVPWTNGTPALSLTCSGSNTLTAYGTAIGNIWSFVINSSDEIFIADTLNNCIYKLYNNVVSLAAGFPGAYISDGDILSGCVSWVRFHAPTGIALDVNGDLYVADRDNYLIRKINFADSTFTTIAGTFGVNTSTGDGGPAISATIIAPHRIAVDEYGNVYVTEEDISGLSPTGLKVRRIDVVTDVINTVAGDGTRGTGGNGGPATLAQLYDPYGLTLDANGNIYITDGSSNVVREVFNRAILTGTPAQSDAGTHNITINAFDGTSTVPQTFTITVTALNQATNNLFSQVGSSQMKVDWTRGNGDGCAVFMKQTDAGTASPLNNTTYTANTVFGTGDQIGSSGWYCVYNGTGTTATVTGLNPSSTYRVHVCEYNIGSVYYNTSAATANPANQTTYSELSASASVVSNVSCFNGNNGSATVAVSGGNPTYGYTWSCIPAQSANTATGLEAGSYTITVTDGVGATATSMVTITQASQFIAGSISSNQVICSMTNPLQLPGVAPTGGSTPYSYQWQSSTDGITFTDITGANNLNYQPGSLTQTTKYHLVQISSNGCGTLETNTVTITVNPSGQVNQPANQFACNHSSTATVNFGTINTGGTTTYTWTNNNTTIGLAANGIGNIPAFTAINPGTSILTANIVVTPTYTNESVSCVGASRTFTFSIYPSPENKPVNAIDAIVCTGTGTNITVSSSLSGSFYRLRKNGTNENIGPALPGNGGTLFFATGNLLSTTTFNVLAFLGNCTAQMLQTPEVIVQSITSAPVITTSHVCEGNTTISGTSETTANILVYSNGLIIGTTTALNGVWTATVSPCIAGNFITATATTSGLCESAPSSSIIVHEITLAPIVTSAICFGTTTVSGTNSEADGTSIEVFKGITSLGITTVSSGIWSLGNLSALAPDDVITAYATAAGKCMSIASPQVIVNPAPVIPINFIATPTQPPCYGQLGSISLNASGGNPPYSYLGLQNPILENLAPGNYNYWVQDANGCQASANTSIVEPIAIALNATPTQPQCFGQTGTISLTVTGGTPGYTYNPANPATSGLGSGLYTYWVSDAHGCSISTSVIINTIPDQLAWMININQPQCFGEKGSVHLAATGGNGTFTFSGSSTANLEPGTYYYTVTDANECSATTSVTITGAPNQLVLTTTPTQIICYQGTASVTLSAIGGTGNYTYSGAATNGLLAGTYTYTVTDANGCTATNSATIIAAPAQITLTGNVKYYSDCHDNLSGVVVNLQQSGNTILTATTDINGNYTFPNVCAGNYDFVLTSATAAGGVNANDAFTVALYRVWVPWTGIPFSPIEKVRLYAGDVFVSQHLASNDAGLIVSHFVNNSPWPGRPDWTFWPTNDLISANPAAGSSSVAVYNMNITTTTSKNFWGLVTGDFDRSSPFAPCLKNGNDNIHLIYEQTSVVNTGSVVNLPVYAKTAMTVGSLSVIMNFPSDKIEVLGVTMTNSSDEPIFKVTGNELRIGWYSLNQVDVAAGEPLFTLKVRTTGANADNENIRFSLANDPLIGLTNAEGIIRDAKLGIDLLATSSSIPGTLSRDMKLSSIPNPFRDNLKLIYTLPEDGRVSLDIYNMLGEKIKPLVNELQTAGEQSFIFDSKILQPGVYTLTLRLNTSRQVLIRTIKIVCN